MDQLLQEILKFRSDRDWEKFHTPRNLAISISLEAAELLENFQWQVGEETITPEIKERAAKEMADIFIYLLSMSHDLSIDLIEAATKKLDESQARYLVEKSRGSSKKYTSSHKVHTAACGI